MSGPLMRTGGLELLLQIWSVIIDDDTPDFFEELRSRVPGNTDEQDEKHLEALLQDILMIESGTVPEYLSTRLATKEKLEKNQYLQGKVVNGRRKNSSKYS